MKKIKIILISMMLMIIPIISLGATGHINGCTNTSFDTSCCTKTFKITPRAGYAVIDVIINGISKGPLTSYTFTNITGPQTLKVVTQAIGGTGTGEGELAEGQFKVLFNANGGTGSMESQIFEEGVTQKLNACTYTREYYNFSGWSRTPDGSAQFVDEGDFSATEETSLYAVWEPIVYTITYNLAGGSVTGNPTTYTVEDNITLINPTKTDYDFVGWTGSNGETAIKTITIPKGSVGNKTYTANWQLKTYTVTITGTGDKGNYSSYCYVRVGNTDYASAATVSAAPGTNMSCLITSTSTIECNGVSVGGWVEDYWVYNFTLTADTNIALDKNGRKITITY